MTRLQNDFNASPSQAEAILAEYEKLRRRLSKSESGGGAGEYRTQNAFNQKVCTITKGNPVGWYNWHFSLTSLPATRTPLLFQRGFWS